MYETCGTDPLAGLVIIFALFIFLMAILKIIGVTKSKTYRKLLVDLYVAGKVRKLANKDGIDLATEFKDFRSVIKKWKMETQPLDDTIEQELQEKTEEDKSNSK